MSLLPVSSPQQQLKQQVLLQQDAFSYFERLGDDERHRGAITKAKLKDAIREQLGLSPSDEAIEDMIDAVDLNSSKDIQFNEFMKMMEQARMDSGEVKADDEHNQDEENNEEKKQNDEEEYIMTRDDIKAIFKKFDLNGDGLISHSELRSMLLEHGEKYADDEIHAMIHLMDSSNSGFISYNAFTRLMLTGN